MGLSLFKLEKLQISAFKNVERTRQIGLPFEVMFNPTSLSQSYAIEWGTRQGFNSSAPQLAYSKSKASDLKIDLIFDGTGVNQIGLFAPFRQSVKERVEGFLEITFRYNGNLHEPNYLLLEWGSVRFSCRLASVDIKYTLFDRDGTALRAELAVTLISDLAASKRAKKEGKSSPDLTHARIVRRGDTLPLLTQEIYGSSASYLDVARFNQLDDFRNLTPGQQLLFPPLTTFSASSDHAEEG